MEIYRFFYSIAKNTRSFYNNLLLKNCFEKEILGYGCGTKDRLLFLARNGAKVTGIDISQEGIKQAKEKIKKEKQNIKNNLTFLLRMQNKLILKIICLN